MLPQSSDRHTYIHTYIHYEIPNSTPSVENKHFLSIHFSETLHLVTACKCEKNVPRAYLIIFTVLAILAKNYPKWACLAQSDKKWRFFAFFSRTTHQIFLIFCSKHRLWSRKKKSFSLFWGNFKNVPFWPKLTQIWPKFGHIWIYEP